MPTDVDDRRLPIYDAGEIDAPYAIAGHSETVERETRWAEHSHPTHELLWNERGASSATVGSRLWTITPSIGLWIPAGTLHHGWMPAGTWHRAAQFNVRSVPSIATGPVAVELTPLLRLLLDRLGDEALDPSSRATTESMVLDVLTPAARELLLREPESPLLAAIVEAIRDDPADATTLAEWSERLAVSTRTITRVFQTETGLGYSQWLAAARAQRAIELLAMGEGIDEVAARLGFSSASAFGTAFRRVTGMTPGRFRLQ